MKNRLTSGLYLDLPNNEYHADAALGSSSIKTIITKSPAHLIGGARKDSAAFDVGSAFHTIVLEPSKESTIVCGGDDRRGNKWKDAKAECDASGHMLLTSDEYSKVFAMRDALMANEDVASLLTGKTVAEASLFHKDEQSGVQCKIRPDLVNHDLRVMVDLKTCVSASHQSFSKAVLEYGYHIQQAFYQRIWNGFYKNDQIDDFYFVAIEKEVPFASAVYELDRMTIMEGHNLVNLGMSIYRKCKALNKWPAYGSGVQRIRIPNYGFKTLSPDEIPVVHLTANDDGVP